MQRPAPSRCEATYIGRFIIEAENGGRAETDVRNACFSTVLTGRNTSKSYCPRCFTGTPVFQLQEPFAFFANIGGWCIRHGFMFSSPPTPFVSKAPKVVGWNFDTLLRIKDWKDEKVSEFSACCVMRSSHRRFDCINGLSLTMHPRTKMFVFMSLSKGTQD